MDSISDEPLKSLEASAAQEPAITVGWHTNRTDGPANLPKAVPYGGTVPHYGPQVISWMPYHVPSDAFPGS